MNTEMFFKTQHHKIKKVVVYQNIKYFLIPSLRYEPINPTHKILVTGVKKRKYSHGNRNQEKVALLLKQYYPMYVVSLFITLGWLIFCKL